MGCLSEERMSLPCTVAAGFSSAVILRSESRRNYDHVLLFQI
jgi:hypothetical protein